MTKIMQFVTDGTAVAGVATNPQTNLAFFQSPRRVAIVDLKQVTCGTVANDADWNLFVDYKDTGIVTIAELINPATTGMKRVFTTPITIHAGAIIQFHWQGQGAAATNVLNVEYEEL